MKGEGGGTYAVDERVLLHGRDPGSRAREPVPEREGGAGEDVRAAEGKERRHHVAVPDLE